MSWITNSLTTSLQSYIVKKNRYFIHLDTFTLQWLHEWWAMASARKVSNLFYHFGSILYLLISTVLESASRHIAVGINVNVRVSERVNNNRTCNGNKTNSKYTKSWTSLVNEVNKLGKGTCIYLLSAYTCISKLNVYLSFKAKRLKSHMFH